ncbi:MAG: hypothetical protein J0I06_01200 [Planctomycetes bacterium]|nr:hypothetical protein [Planctomycetota bacterium]
MRLRPLLIVPALVLLAAAGCGSKPLSENKTLTLDKEVGARSLDVPAQKKAMKMTVEFSSSDGDVAVLVFKGADIKDEDAMLTTEATKAIGSKKGKTDSFSVDVPENTAVRVVVRGHTAAKTDVNLKVTSAP